MARLEDSRTQQNSERTLTRKVTGMLKSGSRNHGVTGRYHVMFGHLKDPVDVADKMAVEAGYEVGDHIEYEMTVRRKAE